MILSEIWLIMCRRDKKPRDGIFIVLVVKCVNHLTLFLSLGIDIHVISIYARKMNIKRFYIFLQKKNIFTVFLAKFTVFLAKEEYFYRISSRLLIENQGEYFSRSLFFTAILFISSIVTIWKHWRGSRQILSIGCFIHFLVVSSYLPHSDFTVAGYSRLSIQIWYFCMEACYFFRH